MNKINMLTIIVLAACGAKRETTPDSVTDSTDGGQIVHMDAPFQCIGTKIMDYQFGCFAEGTHFDGKSGIVTAIAPDVTPTVMYIKDDTSPIIEYNGIAVLADASVYRECLGGPCTQISPSNIQIGDCVGINYGQWAKSPNTNFLHVFEAYDSKFYVVKLNQSSCSTSLATPVITTLPQLAEYTQAFDGTLLTVSNVKVVDDPRHTGNYAIQDKDGNIGYILTYTLFNRQTPTVASIGDCLTVTGIGAPRFSLNQGYDLMPRSQSDLMPGNCP